MDAKKILNPPFHYSSNAKEYFLSRDSWNYMAVVSRENGSISIDDKKLPGKVNDCFGFLGFLHLSASSYIISITEAKYIAILHNCYILMISDIEFLPLGSIKDLIDISLFKTFILSNYFYFSYDLDLTNAFERIFKVRDSLNWKNYDHKYFWNGHLTEEFQTIDASELILPVISGFVQIEQVELEGITIDFGIISRRDHRRAGTRFHTRGLNEEGCAANFVETEQILGWSENGKYRLHCFLQVRGSIPLTWTQKPNLAWTPPVKICEEKKEPSAKHIKELHKIYKEVVFINLIDKKGSQLRLGRQFQEVVESIGKGVYVWFDFHAECKGMKYENLERLVKDVIEFVETYEWSEGIIEDIKGFNCGTISKLQGGVMRTNCVDCLDRTNVVQSLLGRVILHKQLAVVIHQKTSDPFAPFPYHLETCFRDFWTNNADALSNLYTGTPAQKTDFTKTGKRTTAGAINDLKNGLRRYVINNFMDGSRKNIIDGFLGKLKPGLLTRNKKYAHVLIFIGLLLLTVTLLHKISENLFSGLGYYLTFISLLALIPRFFSLIGEKFVESPFISQ
jgi:phosphatidylinositol 4-phosphatase